MKKTITLCTLLLCSTIFAPGNSQPPRLEESAHDVAQAHCCMNAYCAFCASCCLFLAHCCKPGSDDTAPEQPQRILSETDYHSKPKHQKMN